MPSFGNEPYNPINEIERVYINNLNKLVKNTKEYGHYLSEIYDYYYKKFEGLKKEYGLIQEINSKIDFWVRFLQILQAEYKSLIKHGLDQNIKELPDYDCQLENLPALVKDKYFFIVETYDLDITKNKETCLKNTIVHYPQYSLAKAYKIQADFYDVLEKLKGLNDYKKYLLVDINESFNSELFLRDNIKKLFWLDPFSPRNITIICEFYRNSVPTTQYSKEIEKYEVFAGIMNKLLIKHDFNRMKILDDLCNNCLNHQGLKDLVYIIISDIFNFSSITAIAKYASQTDINGNVKSGFLGSDQSPFNLLPKNLQLNILARVLDEQFDIRSQFTQSFVENLIERKLTHRDNIMKS